MVPNAAQDAKCSVSTVCVWLGSERKIPVCLYGWNLFLFSYSAENSSVNSPLPLPSLSPFKYFMGSVLIICTTAAALSRGQDRSTNGMRNRDSVKPISRLKMACFIEPRVRGGSRINWRWLGLNRFQHELTCVSGIRPITFPSARFLPADPPS